MFRLSYNDEMKRLQKLLEEVSTDEESINEDNEGITDEEYFSDHQSNSEEELDSSNESDYSESNEFYLGNDFATKWYKKAPRKNVRTLARNIISKLPGNCAAALKDKLSPIDSWILLIDETILLTITECTNIYISSIASNFQRERDARLTTVSEIKAFIGLLYFGGIHKSSHVNVRDLFATDGSGIDIFHRTMSYKRFLFIMRCLRFDDIRDRSSRRKLDKLAPIRNVFEMFVSNCQKSYTLGEYVTIDEKLEPFRGRCCFRQYIPNKPSKYGLKVFALVDSRTFFTWNLEIYAGTQPDGPYKVDNSPDNVVKRLAKPILNSGRNITLDNWYTSFDLAQDLLQQKITLVGTIRKNKRGIPKEFTCGKNREVYSSLFGYQKNMTLVSYVPKKNKCVVLLSTMHNDGTIDVETGDAKKPEIITFYNLTKGAVDVVDELSALYSTARISNRWPMAIFFSILNTAGINGRVLLLSTKSPEEKYRKRSLYLKELALELLKQHVQERSLLTMLPRELHEQISCSQEADQPEENSVPPSKKQKVIRKRCHMCPSSKDRKSQVTCVKCSQNVCSEHSNVICKQCL